MFSYYLCALLPGTRRRNSAFESSHVTLPNLKIHQITTRRMQRMQVTQYNGLIGDRNLSASVAFDAHHPAVSNRVLSPRHPASPSATHTAQEGHQPHPVRRSVFPSLAGAVGTSVSGGTRSSARKVSSAGWNGQVSPVEPASLPDRRDPQEESDFGHQADSQDQPEIYVKNQLTIPPPDDDLPGEPQQVLVPVHSGCITHVSNLSLNRS